MSVTPLHNGFSVVHRDVEIEAQYLEARSRRAIASLKALEHLGPLGRRLERRLEVIEAALRIRLGGWFDIYLVSSWVDGSGIDKLTEEEEPEFWELKQQRKTWGGIYPDEFKISDYDINVFSSVNKEPVDLRAIFDLHDPCVPGDLMRVHIYPSKGEHGVPFPSNTDEFNHGLLGTGSEA